MAVNKSISEKCRTLYENEGATAVYDYANELIAKGNQEITYAACKGCEAETPHLNGECLICGQ